MLANTPPISLQAKVAWLNALPLRPRMLFKCYGAAAMPFTAWAPMIRRANSDWTNAAKDTDLSEEDTMINALVAQGSWGPHPGWLTGLERDVAYLITRDAREQLRIGLYLDGWEPAGQTMPTIKHGKMLATAFPMDHIERQQYHVFGSHRGLDGKISWFEKGGTMGADVLVDEEDRCILPENADSLMDPNDPNSRFVFGSYWTRAASQPALRITPNRLAGKITYSDKARLYLEAKLGRALAHHDDEDARRKLLKLAQLRGLRREKLHKWELYYQAKPR